MTDMTKQISISWMGALLCSAALLAGCASEPTCDYSEEPYMAAQSVPSLRAPEGLSAPDRTASLVIPPGADEVPGKGACLDRPPSYFATTQPATQNPAPTTEAAKPE
jgi:uncharacterized lipoprotein